MRSSTPCPARFCQRLDHHLAVAGVEGGDHALARQLAQHLGPGRGAEHYLERAAIEPGDRARHVADAAAHAARREIDQVLDDRGVGALAERGVEVDHRDLADHAEAFGKRAGIARIQRLDLAADQLDRMAALQVDRGDDHGRRARRAPRAPLDLGTVMSSSKDRGGENGVGAGIERLLQMLRVAAPPEAITGTRTAAATARVSARS